MSPEALLVHARAAGLILTSDGDTLRVRPTERLTPALRAALLAQKPAVVALLQTAGSRDDLAERVTLRSGVVVSLRALRLGWQLEARGLVLSARDGHLHVTPEDRLTALDHDRIGRHHDELFTLASYAADVT
ncbi:MAG: hypothetical protein EXQ48_02490 [Acidobacteria bacterium]|nr:hypothetical protein [Acidobacteriota bacterium]